MPPPDRPVLDAASPESFNTPLLASASPLSNSSLPASPAAASPYWTLLAAFIANTLTLIGACSDACQKLFGGGQALGVDDITVAVRQADSSLDVLRLGYIFLSASAAFVQSISLEKAFTRDFVESTLHLTAASDDSAELKKLKENPLFAPTVRLNWLEQCLLRVINACGAAVRGISSLMGFYAINNSLALAIKIPSISASSVDALQTLATEGTYLKKLYLLLRLWIMAKVSPAIYAPEFLTAIRHHLDDGDYTCRTTAGRCVYAVTCLFLGSLAALSDVGLAKLVIESFADLYDIDNDNDAFIAAKWSGLSSLFLLISAIDSKTLADKVSYHLENHGNPSPPPASMTTHPALIGLAGFTAVLGGSMTAISAYEGNQYLFLGEEGSSNPLIAAFSILVAAIKFCQSLAVEGSFLLKAARDSLWRPSCRLFNRPMTPPTSRSEQSTTSISTHFEETLAPFQRLIDQVPTHTISFN